MGSALSTRPVDRIHDLEEDIIRQKIKKIRLAAPRNKNGEALEKAIQQLEKQDKELKKLYENRENL